MSQKVLFRQLFEKESSTYTYILGCKRTKKAIIIDPVDLTVERDAKLLKELGLTLVKALNTHVHADHITGTHLLRAHFEGLQTGLGSANTAKSDEKFDDNFKIEVGDINLEVRHTPGHTNGCVTYVDHDGGAAFTGDALLIRGCGRTDFQEGCSKTLFKSVHDRIFSLPEDFKIYPAHDYKGQTSSSVHEEKQFNPRLTKSETEFVDIMENLGLAYPKMIDKALPWNLNCGVEPE
ncbi:Oidioi.mRNA.OKI2018_I69.XSR.g14828.t1.cds [Oikopleura dioica]|uniref:Oidioi.mRNA.OKI2018_I69.XSR.g14828.t1.cds n=1 Tax=Oikopleura dioica TaxID=34765 RepID=A0ABN7SAY2_OIKDI|nr:Oidioi.mRNA.OKI2018_I69.XSR.g14828.t1.cds [Oikopleura dioica]